MIMTMLHTEITLEMCEFRASSHTGEYDSFIKSQLESRNQLQGLMQCKFGHVAFKNPNGINSRTPPSGLRSVLRLADG